VLKISSPRTCGTAAVACVRREYLPIGNILPHVASPCSAKGSLKLPDHAYENGGRDENIFESCSPSEFVTNSAQRLFAARCDNKIALRAARGQLTRSNFAKIA
jgi:hypothetical protein